MKKLPIGLATSAMLLSMSIGASASPDGGFVASATAGSTNALAPELQLQEQRFTNKILHSRLFLLSLKQRLRAGNILAGYTGTSGVASGDTANEILEDLSAWASADYSSADSDFAPAAYDTETYGTSFGLDYVLSDKLSIGGYLSYSNSDTDTSFNGGNTESDSISFGPYASYMINDIFSVDASIGYTLSDIDNERLVGAVIATGSQDGDTVFYAANLNAQKWIDNWGISGRLGYSHSRNSNDAYTDSLGTAFASTRSTLGQIQIGSKVSYYTETAMPYFGVTYINDISSPDVSTATPPQPANDDDEFQLDAGVDFFNEGAISGGLSANYSLGRDQYDAWGLGANIGYKF